MGVNFAKGPGTNEDVVCQRGEKWEGLLEKAVSLFSVPVGGQVSCPGLIPSPAPSQYISLAL